MAALAGAGHAMPQPLQLSTSLLVLASQPFLGSMSQSVKPGLHADTAHLPAEHSMIALGAAHTLPQAPQLRASALVGFSQPFLTSWSQSPKPALHLATTHVPKLQPGVPLDAAGHALPQPPQFITSVWV